MSATISKGDTPNQFRTKVNNNFTQHDTDLTNKLNIDGSNAMLAPLPMGGNRIVNVGNGVSSNDAMTLGQGNLLGNRLIERRCAYVIEGITGTEVIYIDGTSGDYALRVGKPGDAFTAITDATSGNEWNIIIFPGRYETIQFRNLNHYINITGIGKVELIGDNDTLIANSCIIDSNSEWKNVKVKAGAATDDFILKGNLKGENCIFYTPTADLILGNVNIEYSKLIGKSGSKILLDSTSSNYVNFCTISDDFGGTGTLDANAINQINTDLETKYQF